MKTRAHWKLQCSKRNGGKNWLVHETRNILLSPFISNLHPRVGHTMDVLSPFISATICPILRHLCNLSFQRGIFPSQLKHALVTSRLEKPALDPDTASSYRPISPSPFYHLFPNSSNVLSPNASRAMSTYSEQRDVYLKPPRYWGG